MKLTILGQKLSFHLTKWAFGFTKQKNLSNLRGFQLKSASYNLLNICTFPSISAEAVSNNAPFFPPS
jgi:hypothetical protein